MILPERKRGLRRAVPRSSGGKLAVLAVSTGAMGYICARFIAPGPVGGWLRAQRTRRASASRHSGPVDERFPARLRLEAPGTPAGPWLRGEIHVQPGSLVWEPATGVHAVPTELAAAAIVPEDARRGAKRGRAVIVDTPAGRIQLECDAGLLALLQRIAADLAKSSHVETTSAEAPGRPSLER